MSVHANRSAKNFLKKISNHTWKPAVQFYLRKPRKYNFEAISIEVAEGVFHPGLFFSTKQLLRFLKKEELKGKNILELGCGSGLISIFVSKHGATVTACDIAPGAVKCAAENFRRNGIKDTPIVSDLFSSLKEKQFDLIIVNPPFYRGKAKNEAENAWYAGVDLEYFTRFFSEVKSHLTKNGSVLMVLSSDCDIRTIVGMAEANKLKVNLEEEHGNLWEKGLIFRIAV